MISRIRLFFYRRAPKLHRKAKRKSAKLRKRYGLPGEIKRPRAPQQKVASGRRGAGRLRINGIGFGEVVK
jgi:hypothetical protein